MIDPIAQPNSLGRHDRDPPFIVRLLGGWYMIVSFTLVCFQSDICDQIVFSKSLLNFPHAIQYDVSRSRRRSWGGV
jgi:hypothetical protein